MLEATSAPVLPPPWLRRWAKGSGRRFVRKQPAHSPPARRNCQPEPRTNLRSRLQTTQRFWASARASAKLPVTGTQITGSYQWMDYDNTIMPDHFYLTQDLYLGAGLNVMVRQPIPSLFGIPGRLEATAELRNGLAQGYLPIVEGGQHVTLVESPRALRGGLSFIF